MLVRKANPDISDAEEEDDEDEAEGEEWAGIEEPDRVDAMDEYVDEDKYTTVTIEAMDDPRDTQADSEDQAKAAAAAKAKEDALKAGTDKKKRIWTREKPGNGVSKVKPKKKKFRYESKAERKVTRQKQNSKNTAAAKERRSK